ncbi:regulator of microtubule dynamics protein 2-like [Daphnia pulicaria]|uniref:regulator of microtubule dynamics protein 2-like n=1 Tax=Daphnia pulicaria TaxID=35523 RepID=UPI001EEBF352|nr:regulator of microtubule dynamics protein 2-like [Daphnia pulicaria]
MGNNISNVDSKPVVIILGGLVTSSSILAVWFFYDRINRATRFDNLKETNCNIEQLNSAIDILRKEIEELKAASSKVDLNIEKDEDCKSKKSFKVVRFKNTLSYMSSTSDVEYQSAWSDNEGSTEEFFDFPENDLGDQINITNISSEAIDLFDKVDSLLEGSSADHEVAFRLLTDHESEFDCNVEFLWRIAKSCRMAAQASPDPNRQKELSFKAVDWAKKALSADEANAEANKWFAISLGATSCYVSVSEKIRNGVLFKEYIDKAIQINPSDYLLHHLLGRFSFEVSSLSWIERKVAAALFKDIPSGSIEEALSHFLHSDKLRAKPSKTNSLYIAKCFIQLGKYDQAMHWINLALPISVMTTEDQSSHDELLILHSKYNSYL